MIPYCVMVIEDESDREFMSQLFIRYQRLMYHEAFKITHEKYAAEDAMQNALVRLIDKIALLRTLDETKLINYIITAMKNSAYNYMARDVKPDFSFDELRDVCDGVDERELIDERIDMYFLMHTLASVWPQLDERSRYLLEGRYILEKSTDEMARDLSIKPESVRMALTRARRRARQLMNSKKC